MPCAMLTRKVVIGSIGNTPAVALLMPMAFPCRRKVPPMGSAAATYRLALVVLSAVVLGACQASLAGYAPGPTVVRDSLYGNDPSAPYYRPYDPFERDRFRGPRYDRRGYDRGDPWNRDRSYRSDPWDRDRHYRSDPFGRSASPFGRTRRGSPYAGNGRCDDPRYETSNGGRAAPGSDDYDCSRHGNGLKGRYR
jgi:hypothetical protein